MSGVLGGAGVGAQVGSMIAPGVGTAIGAGIGALVGGIQGNQRKKALDSALAGINAIPAIDPTMTEFASQVERERRAVQSGLTTEFQAGRDMLERTTSGATNLVGQVYAQNPALMLSSLSRIQNQGAMQANQMLGAVGQNQMKYSDMLRDTLNRISQRALDVNMHKAQQKLGVATQNQSDFNKNMMAGAMMLPGVIGEAGEPVAGAVKGAGKFVGDQLGKLFVNPSFAGAGGGYGTSKGQIIPGQIGRPGGPGNYFGGPTALEDYERGIFQGRKSAGLYNSKPIGG